MGVKDEYMRMGEEAVAEAAASFVSGEIAATSALPPVVPAIVYRDKLPKMPEVIIEGILLEGHKMLLTGPSKANKTWCLINLAVSVATGGYWIDFACAKRKVLFVDLETDARTLQRRISRVAEAKGADPAVVAANLFVWPLRGKSCGLSQIVDELFARFEPGAFGMVIIASKSVESAEAMASLPMRIDQTLDMVQKGHVKIGMELSSNEKLSKDIRAAAGLIAIALIAMGLVVGACILGASANAVSLGGVPLFGGLGLVVGVGLAIYVFVNIRPYLK